MFIIKNKLKKYKVNNLIMKIINICIILFIFFIIGYKYGELSNNTYYRITKENEIEKSKYKEMLKNENKARIIKYLNDKIENNEYIPIDVMNYLFKNIYKDATSIERDNIYSLYFENVNNYILKYSDMLNQNGYNDTIRKLISNNKNINKKDILGVQDEFLKVILTEINVNYLTIKDNNPYIIVLFDYSKFLNNFGYLLDSDYLTFTNLEKNANDIIINPNYLNINLEGLSWYLINYEDFIKTNKNETLRYAAQHVYLQNLGIFFGVSNVGLFYQNQEEGNYKVSQKFIDTYKEFIKTYPNSNTSELIEKILNIIDKSDGKDSLSDAISKEIYDYLNNCDWIPVKPKDDNTLIIDDFN